MPIIRLENAGKYYKMERRRIRAVSEIDLTIRQGEFVFVVGSSGAGKSTLLQLLSGQIRADEGSVFIDGLNITHQAVLFRSKARRSFGYVSQLSQLMRRRTVLDNLTMAARVSGLSREKKLKELAEKTLSIVGLSGYEWKYPAEMSIGECRRIELARAIINSPPVLVLDELTANLDEDNIWDIFHILQEMNRQGTTIVMATHASMFVNLMRRRVITLVDGRIAGDVRSGRYGDLTGNVSGERKGKTQAESKFLREREILQ